MISAFVFESIFTYSSCCAADYLRMLCRCALFFLYYFRVPVLYRMCAVVSFVVPILESLATRCGLPSLIYLCEVTEDGSVLAGVELELPTDGTSEMPERRFFWTVVWRGCMDAYDHAASQAIRFLQGMYGFVVRDYNYDSMLAYRDCMHSAVVVASLAARHAARFEREAGCPLTVVAAASGTSMRPAGGCTPFDWLLFCSRLATSLRYV